MEKPAPMVTPLPSTAKVAFYQGLNFGLIQAFIASVALIGNAYMEVAGVGLLLSAVSFLTGLAAYFVSGSMGAKQNGKVRTGVFAGMWTGGISGIIGFGVNMLIFFQMSLPRVMNNLTYSTTTSPLSPDSVRSIAIISGVGSGIIGIVFAVGLGAGLGALGGLIGRNISPFKPMKLVPALVPVYAPYPGQQVYQAPSAYPTQPYADPNQPTYPSQPAKAEQIYGEQPATNPYAGNPPQQ